MPRAGCARVICAVLCTPLRRTRVLALEANMVGLDGFQKKNRRTVSLMQEQAKRPPRAPSYRQQQQRGRVAVPMSDFDNGDIFGIPNSLALFQKLPIQQNSFRIDIVLFQVIEVQGGSKSQHCCRFKRDTNLHFVFFKIRSTYHV